MVRHVPTKANIVARSIIADGWNPTLRIGSLKGKGEDGRKRTTYRSDRNLKKKKKFQSGSCERYLQRRYDYELEPTANLVGIKSNLQAS